MQGESFRLNVNTHSGHALKVFTLEPESVFTIKQIRCSRSSGMGVHVGPEYAAGLTVEIVERNADISRRNLMRPETELQQADYRVRLSSEMVEYEKRKKLSGK